MGAPLAGATLTKLTGAAKAAWVAGSFTYDDAAATAGYVLGSCDAAGGTRRGWDRCPMGRVQLLGTLGNALIVGAQPRRQVSQTGVRGGARSCAVGQGCGETQGIASLALPGG